MVDLHLFDLDDTLFKEDKALCIINKKRPQDIVLRIPLSEITLMKSYYKKYNNTVQYNGNVWYLSDKQLEEINLPIEDIGVSERELNSDFKSNIKTKKTKFIFDNISHLKNKFVDVRFVSSNSNQDDISYLKSKVKERYNIIIKNVYNIDTINSDFDYEKFRKSCLVLEFLIGYKIKNNRFIKLEQPNFDTVSYYDDDIDIISNINNLQKVFEQILLNTNRDLKDEIINMLEFKDLKYITYHITSNKARKFIKKEHVLLLPTNILFFKDFIKD